MDSVCQWLFVLTLLFFALFRHKRDRFTSLWTPETASNSAKSKLKAIDEQLKQYEKGVGEGRKEYREGRRKILETAVLDCEDAYLQLELQIALMSSSFGAAVEDFSSRLEFERKSVKLIRDLASEETRALKLALESAEKRLQSSAREVAKLHATIARSESDRKGVIAFQNSVESLAKRVKFYKELTEQADIKENALKLQLATVSGELENEKKEGEKWKSQAEMWRKEALEVRNCVSEMANRIAELSEFERKYKDLGAVLNEKQKQSAVEISEIHGKCSNLTTETENLRKINAKITQKLHEKTRESTQFRAKLQSLTVRCEKSSQKIASLKCELRDLLRTREEDEKSYECVVCLSAKKTEILEPCSHFCICSDCGRKIKECPLCKREIEGRKRVFG